MQNILNIIGALASILSLILAFIKRRWIIEIVKRIIACFAGKCRNMSFRCRLRKAFLSMLQPNLSGIAIVSICNRGGAVTLILPGQEAMYPGVIYEAWDSISNEVVGLVEIDSLGHELCYSKPIDRIESPFGIQLEKRMDRDASPPENIVLYPYIAMMEKYDNILFDFLIFPGGKLPKNYIVIYYAKSNAVRRSRPLSFAVSRRRRLGFACLRLSAKG